MGYVIEYDYDYTSKENYDYNYDYDYLKKCNRLQSNTIAITITPALPVNSRERCDGLQDNTWRDLLSNVASTQ